MVIDSLIFVNQHNYKLQMAENRVIALEGTHVLHLMVGLALLIIAYQMKLYFLKKSKLLPSKSKQ